MITLRPATLETVRPLRLRAPDSDWRFWIDGTLIAFDGDTPVGMANLNLDREPAEIFGVWVAPEARGHGRPSPRIPWLMRCGLWVAAFSSGACSGAPGLPGH
jgi:hypothetical protein